MTTNDTTTETTGKKIDELYKLIDGIEIAMFTTSRWWVSGSVAVSQVDSSSACGAPFSGAMGTPLIPLTTRH